MPRSSMVEDPNHGHDGAEQCQHQPRAALVERDGDLPPFVLLARPLRTPFEDVLHEQAVPEDQTDGTGGEDPSPHQSLQQKRHLVVGHGRVGKHALRSGGNRRGDRLPLRAASHQIGRVSQLAYVA
jgi:hypothetical protein